MNEDDFDNEEANEEDQEFGDLTSEYLDNFTTMFSEMFNDLDPDDEDDDIKRDALILSSFLFKKYVETQVIPEVCCDKHAEEMTNDFNNIAEDTFKTEKKIDYSKLN